MKKLAAILLSLMFVFALCACGSDDSSTADSSTAESSESESVVGKWTMESYEDKGDMPEGTKVDAKMEMNDDNTFTFTVEKTISSLNGNFVVTGTYEETDDKIKFDSKHATTTALGQTSETDEPDDFTGEFKEDKLTVTNTKSSPHTFILKRA